MTTETRAQAPPRRPPWAARVLLAPAVWLERARGRKRLALGLLYLIMLALGVLLGWRAFSLRDLPDIGDPFDVRAFTNVSQDGDQDAFTIYAKAVGILRIAPSHVDLRKLPDWAGASAEIRGWAEQNREALGLWMRAADRPRGAFLRPGQYHFESILDVPQKLREFARLAHLEGTRREAEGDFAGAFAAYRALLRSSRHVQTSGGPIQRIIGMAMGRVAVDRLVAWADRSEVDAPLLRRALADAAEAERMTPPNSEALKVEYLAVRAALDGPARWLGDERAHDTDWQHHLPGYLAAEDFFRREPERARRVLALVFANWLAHCDEPPTRRPRLAPRGSTFELYDAPTAPRPGSGPAAGRVALAPEAIAAWADTSTLARLLSTSYGALVRALDADRRALGALRLHLAEALYRREHGGSSPARLGDLVGTYLDALPDGYADSEPPPARP